VNLDNAATTPPLRAVAAAVDEFVARAASVHRGSGYKSRYATQAYESARDEVAAFVGADPAHHTVIFTGNTTDAINRLSRRLAPELKGTVIVSTLLEHHANDLPWRRDAEIVRARPTAEGGIDLDHLAWLLQKYRGRCKLVALTGASNVTGAITDLRTVARLAHSVGAEVFVDAAQLVPHRRVDMSGGGDPEARIDYLAFSAHKMYAPYGAGALIAPRAHLEDGEPPIAGGGAVLAVDIDAVHWAPPPAREEAGTPNAVGVIAMAAAARALMETGLEAIAEHERALTARLLAGLRAIPGVTLYGDGRAPTAAEDRVGVVPFNVAGVPHGLVAAVLGWERAVGVRSGCFCAHPFVKHLLGLTAEEQVQLTQATITGHREELPGLVRASLGLYNTEEDVDLLLEGVRAIAAEPDAAATRYRFSPADEEYLPTTTPDHA